MLKNRINAEDFDKLPDNVKEHYSKGNDSAGEGYFLQTEEAGRLKRSLDTERRRAEGLTKVVKKIAPDLATRLEDGNRDEWDELADDEAERLKAYRDLGTPEEVREALDAKGDGKGGKDKDELQQKILELSTQKREAERARDAAQREKDKIEKRAGKVALENEILVRQRDISEALDAIGVRDPEDREVVSAIWQAKGLKVNKVGEGEDTKSETFIVVDGQELPVKEYGKDFAATQTGKRFVKAPDHGGAGDGPQQRRADTTRKSDDPSGKMVDPLQSLTSVFEKNAAAANNAR